MDRWGRRPTLLVGVFFMGTWMSANAGILAQHGEIVEGGIDGVAAQSMRVTGAPARGLIACTYLFVASFAVSMGPTSWVYPPELFPLKLRGKGVALSTSFNWAFNTALGLFVPEAFANIKWRTYVIFAAFNAAMFIHIFLLFPETAGKTLEQVEEVFEDPNGFKHLGTPAWKTRKAAKHMSRAERGGDLEAAGMGLGAKKDIVEEEKAAA